MKKILLSVSLLLSAAVVWVYSQTFGGLNNQPITLDGLKLLQGEAATIAGNVTLSGNTTQTGTIAVGGGVAIAKILAASAALNFPSIDALSSTNLTITVTGATTNGIVSLGTDGVALETGISLFGYVSTANTVQVRAVNATAAAVDPAIRTVHALVIER